MLAWGPDIRNERGVILAKKWTFTTSFHIFLALYRVFSGLGQCCNSLVTALLPLFVFQLLEHLHMQVITTAFKKRQHGHEGSVD